MKLRFDNFHEISLPITLLLTRILLSHLGILGFCGIIGCVLAGTARDKSSLKAFGSYVETLGCILKINKWSFTLTYTCTWQLKFYSSLIHRENRGV